VDKNSLLRNEEYQLNAEGTVASTFVPPAGRHYFEGALYVNGAKRWLDVTLSLILIVMLLPVFLIVAIAVAITSRGKVLLAQPRVGWKGEVFGCYKFRTMYSHIHDENLIEQATVLAQQGILLKLEEDPRITPVGKFLRRSSLDELPQLFNVLKGDMSLIGPRPLVQLMANPYPVEVQIRGVIRPGITGLWQTRSRDDGTSIYLMMPHDVEYIQTVSLKNDLKILAATIPAVLLAKGAK